MENHILELYSGIGGMHCAWNESGLPGEVVTAVDVNTVANEVYQHNFPKTHLLNKNIQSLSAKQIKLLDVNTILMSPPCQPFTRNGKYLDVNDNRTDSFIHLIDILNELENIEYILLENVKGFECSTVRNLFISKLQSCQFEYQEFLLCPTAVGVPNSRLRYYCIARRTNKSWSFKTNNEIMLSLPKENETPMNCIGTILDADASDQFLIPDKHLRRANVFDICYKDSKRSCCFTKAYSHYMDGTGSVFTDASPEEVRKCLIEANNFVPGSPEYVKFVKPLKLRFMTPKEVLALMTFPVNYSFPDNTTRKQCYRLLGNSVNVRVISELLKLLFIE